MTFGVAATGASAAPSAASPDAGELTALIDGRIPALTGIDEAALSPDGQQIGVIAEIGPSGTAGVATEQLWLLGTDGSKLRRLEDAWNSPQPVSSNFFNLEWSPDSRFLATNMGTVAAPDYWTLLDVSGPITRVEAREVGVSHADFASDSSSVELEIERGLGTAPRTVDIELTAPDAALEPSEAELAAAALVHDRIAGAVEFREVTRSSDGSRIAFLVGINYQEAGSTDDALWIVNANGTGLTRLDALGPWSWLYDNSLGAPRFSGTGRFLLHERWDSTADLPTLVPTDVSGAAPTAATWSAQNFVLSDDDRFVVFVPYASTDYPVLVKDLTTGDTFTAAIRSDAVDHPGYTWAPACSGAADAGVTIPRRFAPPHEIAPLDLVLEQVTSATPGCRLEPWPEAPAPPVQGPPVVLATPLVVSPVAPAAPQAKRPAQVSPFVSARTSRSRKGQRHVRSVHVRLRTAGAKRLKVYAILGTGSSKRTLARRSTASKSATVRVSLHLSRTAQRRLARSRATSITLRVVTVGQDNTTTMVERKVKL